MNSPKPTSSASSVARKHEPLTKHQIITIAVLLLGYAGYYLCRVHLSVSSSSLIEEFKSSGINKERIGDINALGLLFYAAGKFINGINADSFGGKRMFLVGMGGAIVCTMFFGLSSTLPMFTIAWALNRAVQSGGWCSLVKISSKWFSYSMYGTIMGVISLSYLFGDFLSRLFLGQLLTVLEARHVEHPWRMLFFAAAGGLAVIFLISVILLKESPSEVGEPEPELNPESVYAESEEAVAENPGTIAVRPGLLGLLLPLLKSPTFWVVCILSFGFTMVRETFNDWIPTYLHEVTGMEKGLAGKYSSLFPLFGGFSVLIAGFLSDRLGPRGRAQIILGGLVLATPAFLALAFVNFGKSPFVPILAFGSIAFLLLGPYSFFAGAIGMDFGGKTGSATASGFIDGVGYIGGMLAGKLIGHIADDPNRGWPAAFQTLAVIAGLSTVAAAVYLAQKNKSVRQQEVLN